MNMDCFSNGIPSGFWALFPDEVAFYQVVVLTIVQSDLFLYD